MAEVLETRDQRPVNALDYAVIQVAIDKQESFILKYL
jgi:hypothetical protein